MMIDEQRQTNIDLLLAQGAATAKTHDDVMLVFLGQIAVTLVQIREDITRLHAMLAERPVR